MVLCNVVTYLSDWLTAWMSRNTGVPIKVGYVVKLLKHLQKKIHENKLQFSLITCFCTQKCAHPHVWFRLDQMQSIAAIDQTCNTCSYLQCKGEHVPKFYGTFVGLLLHLLSMFKVVQDSKCKSPLTACSKWNQSQNRLSYFDAKRIF